MMDSFMITRTAMAGWIYAAVTLAFLHASNSPALTQFTQQIANDKGYSAFAIGLLGAIIGIGAPPAIGFILERVVSIILMLCKQNLWDYDSVIQFKIDSDKIFEANGYAKTSTPKGAIFHIFFYTYADSKLLEWARRRRAHMYASFTSSLSVLIAIVTAVFIFDSFSRLVFGLSIGLVGIFIWHGIREWKYHKQLISEWITLYGNKVVEEFVASKTKEATTGNTTKAA